MIPPQALLPYAQALKKRLAKRRDRVKKDDKARVKSEQAAIEREKESVRWGQSLHRPSNEEHAFPILHDTSGREREVQEGVASLFPSPAPQPPSAPLSDKTTVWGTRVVESPATPPQRRQQPAEEDTPDLAVEDAWNDFEALQVRGGRREGRKKKVVLNLSGGVVSMRR